MERQEGRAERVSGGGSRDDGGRVSFYFLEDLSTLYFSLHHTKDSCRLSPPSLSLWASEGGQSDVPSCQSCRRLAASLRRPGDDSSGARRASAESETFSSSSPLFGC